MRHLRSLAFSLIPHCMFWRYEKTGIRDAITDHDIAFISLVDYGVLIFISTLLHWYLWRSPLSWTVIKGWHHLDCDGGSRSCGMMARLALRFDFCEALASIILLSSRLLSSCRWRLVCGSSTICFSTLLLFQAPLVGHSVWSILSTIPTTLSLPRSHRRGGSNPIRRYQLYPSTHLRTLRSPRWIGPKRSCLPSLCPAQETSLPLPCSTLSASPRESALLMRTPHHSHTS